MKWKAAVLALAILIPAANGCALDPMPVDAAGSGGAAGEAGASAGGRAGSSTSAGSAGRAGADPAGGGDGGSGEGAASGEGGSGENAAAGEGGAGGEADGASGSAGDGGAAGDREPVVTTQGGYHLTWTLRRQSDNTPITCEQADGHTVSVLTTLVSNASVFSEDLFDCSAGSGMVVRDFAEYAVVASLANDTNQSIGAAPTEYATLVEAPCDSIVGTICVQAGEAVITVNGF